ncbi:hypothetical protein VTJ49DRAFT_841 [Mycothermus thermophilus]|uniref:Uncharacterized protein n=1 Tax=Humicola insolens TaxID=85995 RepID=A0ABR3VE12_HUMIN
MSSDQSSDYVPYRPGLPWYGRLVVYIIWVSIPACLACVFLAGCTSNAMANFALYEVNVTSLAESLKAAGGSDVAPLVPPELPTHWNIGISGRCDNFTTTGEVYCHRAFLPSQNVLTVVEESLRDSLRRRDGQGHEDQHDELVDRVLTSWNEALARHPTSSIGVIANRGTTEALLRTSAALTLIELVMGLGWPLIILGRRQHEDWGPRGHNGKPDQRPTTATPPSHPEGASQNLSVVVEKTDECFGVPDQPRRTSPA